MLSRIKLQIVAGILAMSTAGLPSSAQESAPLKPADFQKIIGLVDTVGTRETFPPPIALNLGLSQDPKKELPVVSIVTTDRKIYFCRSQLDTSDYIIWVIGVDEKSSSMFVTHADLKLARALYMHADSVPQLQYINDPVVEADYQQALVALARDLQKTPGKTKSQ